MNIHTSLFDEQILEVENLQLGRSGSRAFSLVNGVSFSLKAGKTLALVGESGSGKSLTALSVLRLLPEPSVRVLGGSIRFEGRDLLSLNGPDLRDVRGGGIAMIFQEPLSALNPVMSIGNQLREAVRAHEKLDRKATDKRVIELLELVRMPDPERVAREFPHRLSGGMRQRVLIAMAMAGRPRVLIADEPTTALDVTVQAEVLDTLRGLQDKFGLAILLITHDLGLVADYASDVAVMYAGRIVEHGPVHEVLGSPFHPYTRGLLNARPHAGQIACGGVRPRLTEITGSVPNPLDMPSGCPFWPRCPVATGACQLRRPSLSPVGINHAAACFKAEALT
ncbi:MAG: ABC transporter ATP-binding protein [Parvibaculaceae bacterium]|nr:ABC transporter ATP-binding protein [Parvibaculaceae bacterium]